MIVGFKIFHKWLPIFESFNEKSKAIAFVRMNPVTSGHEKVYNLLKKVAKKHGADHEIVASGSHDPDKNPLSPAQKKTHLGRAFPDTKVSIADKSAPTIISHAKKAHAEGYSHLHVIAGEDRAEHFNNLLHKYNGGKDYNFKSITVHKIPRTSGAISASKMRDFARNDDFKSFHKNLPGNIKKNPTHSSELFNDVKKGMIKK